MSRVEYKKWLCRPVEFKKTSSHHVDFKKVPCRMSLKPKKGCFTMSILGVCTHNKRLISFSI